MAVNPVLMSLRTKVEKEDAFSLSASRYFGDRKTLCLYWPLGTVVITGPKGLDFYACFCAHWATFLKADEKISRT
jgi:hypothetical protein